MCQIGKTVRTVREGADEWCAAPIWVDLGTWGRDKANRKLGRSWEIDPYSFPSGELGGPLLSPRSPHVPQLYRAIKARTY